MATEPPTTAEFPEDLSVHPEARRVQEAYGWAPAAWGLGCLCLAWLALFQPAALASGEMAVFGASVTLALVLFVVEAHRRRRPRVLVRPAGSPLVGVYRDGKLQRTVEVARCGRYGRRALNTWGPLGLLLLGMVACGMFLREGLPGPTLGERLLPVLLIAFGLALFTSLLKTRLRCVELLLPREGGWEHVLVTRGNATRLLG